MPRRARRLATGFASGWERDRSPSFSSFRCSSPPSSCSGPNALDNMAALGSRRASRSSRGPPIFEIDESLIAYSAGRSVGRAILVNTLSVSESSLRPPAHREPAGGACWPAMAGDRFPQYPSRLAARGLRPWPTLRRYRLDDRDTHPVTDRRAAPHRTTSIPFCAPVPIYRRCTYIAGIEGGWTGLALSRAFQSSVGQTSA